MKPAARVQFLLHHLAERFAVAPHRAEQDHEILHRAAEHDADQNPQRAGQITELRRQHRPDQRPRPGDRREVMAEDDPLVRLDEILAVVVDFARRGAAVIEHQHARGNPFRVKPVADGVGAKRGDEDIGRIERLAAMEREHGVGAGAGQREREPKKCAKGFLQIMILDLRFMI